MKKPNESPPLPAVLQNHKVDIADMSISWHTEKYNVDNWRKRFSSEAVVEAIITSHPGSLSRDDLTKMGDQARTGDPDG